MWQIYFGWLLLLWCLMSWLQGNGIQRTVKNDQTSSLSPSCTVWNLIYINIFFLSKKKKKKDMLAFFSFILM